MTDETKESIMGIIEVGQKISENLNEDDYISHKFIILMTLMNDKELFIKLLQLKPEYIARIRGLMLAALVKSIPLNKLVKLLDPESVRNKMIQDIESNPEIDQIIKDMFNED